MRNLLKPVLYLLLLTLSPLVAASAAGAVYVGVQLMHGVELPEAVDALTELVRAIMPYLPALTTIPAVLIVLAVLLKNRGRITSWFRARGL